MTKRQSAYIISFTIFLQIIPSGDVYSQPPGTQTERATYETDQLGRQAEAMAKQMLRGKPAPIKEAEEPVVEDAETFPVKKINLEGCEAFPPESFSEILSKYENRDIGINAIQRLCKNIEREYLKRGIIAAVFAPPQDIKEGALTLKVIEAKMGELRIADAMWFDKDRLVRYWPIKAGEILRYDRISKSIQLMNKNPDREVKAALHAGKTAGTTDVSLTPETQVPIHSSFTYDNDGSAPTGTLRTGFGIRHNNLLNNDDMLLSGYTYGKDFNSFYAYHNLPINYSGASLLYGGSKSVSTPMKDFQPFDMRTWADKLDFSVHQDIYMKDEYVGEVYAQFSAQDKRTYANTGGPFNSGGGTINKDRLRTLIFGGTYLKRAIGATSVLTSQFTQGMDILGASSRHDPYLTRGAPSVYSKWVTTLQTRAALPFNLTQSLKINTQFASCKLNPSEGMSFGGIDSIRGYPPGDVIMDNAILTNYELTSPLFFLPKEWRLPYAQAPLKEDFQAVAFIDYGYGKRRGELKNYNEMGIGPGLRFNFYNQAKVRLEFGYPVGDHPYNNGRAWFFHFAVNFNDTLPQEMARIAKAMDEARVINFAWQLLEEEMRRPGSPVKDAMYREFAAAELAEGEGRLEDARVLYKRVRSMGDALYRQAEDYVRSLKEREDDMKCENSKAAALYEAGKLEEAREIWDRVAKGVKPAPFFLDLEAMKTTR